MSSPTRTGAPDAAPRTAQELERARAAGRKRLRGAVEQIRADSKKSGAAKLSDEEIEREVRAARAERRTKR